MFNPSRSSTATRPLVQHKAKAQMESVGSRADAVGLALLLTYITHRSFLMIGLAATRLLGWWWLGSVAALALIPFLIKNARAKQLVVGPIVARAR
jgi:hypothetical protein